MVKEALCDTATVVSDSACYVYIKTTNAQGQETTSLPRLSGALQPLKLQADDLDSTGFWNTGVTYLWTRPDSTTTTTDTLVASTIGEYKLLVSKQGRTCEAYVTLNAKPCVVRDYTTASCQTVTINNPTATNQLSSLAPGDVFYAADYSIHVTEASGGAGGWSGKGYVEVLLPLGVTSTVAVTFSGIAINDCYELTNGTVETEYDANKQLLDVDEILDALKELLPNVKLFAQHYRGTAEDIENAKFLEQQLEAAKAALLANDSYDATDKNLIQQGYDQQLAGLTYLIENGGSCSEPIDSTTSLVGGRLAAFGATLADVCSARNATLQGAKKAEEGIFLAIWKVLQRCQATNFASHNGGFLPKCLWDNNIGTAYVSDPAFIAGFIDGAYLTVSDLFQGAVSAAECAICFNPTGPGFYSAKCQDVRNKTVEFFEFFRTLATDGQLRDKVWGELKQQAAEYLDQTLCVQEPICRYNQGKLIFDIASMFVGIGEVSGVVKTGLKAKGLLKVVQAIEKVESVAKVVHRAINGVGGKFVKTASRGVVDVLSATGEKIAKLSGGVLEPLQSAWSNSYDASAKVLRSINNIKYRNPNNTTTVFEGNLEVIDAGGCSGKRLAAGAACNVKIRVKPRFKTFEVRDFATLSPVNLISLRVPLKGAYRFLAEDKQLAELANKAILATSDLQSGDFVEMLARKMFHGNDGHFSLNQIKNGITKYSSTQGFDDIIVKPAIDFTKDIDKIAIEELIIVEAKPKSALKDADGIAKGGASIEVGTIKNPAGNPAEFAQMSDEWIRITAQKLINNGTADQKKIGGLIIRELDAQKVKKAIVAVDKATGEIIVQKLN